MDSCFSIEHRFSAFRDDLDAVDERRGFVGGLIEAGRIEGAAPPLSLPRALGTRIEEVVPHSDPERYALLYGAIWRVLHGERALLDVASDPLVHRAILEAIASMASRAPQ